MSESGDGEDVVEVLPYAVPENAEDRWRVGTLTYTFGGLCVLFFWLLWGDFAFYLKERSVPQTMTLLLKTFHASDKMLGFLVATLPQLLAIALGPIISYKSDRHRGRWGRRIPYLMVPTPIAFFSMIGLAYSPSIGHWANHALGRDSAHEQSTILICFALFWMVFEFCTMTCNAVFGALINDVVPRPVIGRFFAMFRILSLGAGMLFNFYLYGKVAQYYVPIFLGIGTIYFVSFTAMCLRVKEGEYPPPAPAPEGGAIEVVGSAVAGYLRDCFSLPYYCWFFASIALAYVAFTPINVFSIPFSKSLGMSDDMYGKYSTLQLGLSMVMAFPIGWLCDKVHSLRMTIISLVLYAATTLIAFLFVRTPGTFAAAHVICGTFSGFWLTATASLAPALLPKLKFAQFYSAMILCYSATMAITAFAAGWLLDSLHHDYHYIYLLACSGITASLLASLIVHQMFMNYGGPRAYVAPE